MAIPLERESRMWGIFFASDFKKLIVLFILDAFVFMGFFLWWGLTGSLVVFFSVLTLSTLYFVVKSFWPEKHLNNLIRYRREPKRYFPGREESEFE